MGSAVSLIGKLAATLSSVFLCVSVTTFSDSASVAVGLRLMTILVIAHWEATELEC